MKRILLLLGQTASGKSAVGRILARRFDDAHRERFDAEILSLDSMKVYRGMDVGTAKPSAGEQSEVPHHLIDLVEPTEPFSTGRYREAFEDALAGVRGRGKTPIVEGGTALYAKALVSGFFEGPAADWPLREELKARAIADGPESLHAELAEVDPAYAAKIHPNDVRRVVRGLEVHRLTGKPLSSFHVHFGSGAGSGSTGLPPSPAGLRGAGTASGRFRIIVLRRTAEDLRERIRARVKAMFAAGWVDEAEALLARHPRLDRTPRQALGYRAIWKALEEGRDPRAEEEGIAGATWKFARKQMAWFKTFPDVTWIDVRSDETAAEIAVKIEECSRAGGNPNVQIPNPTCPP